MFNIGRFVVNTFRPTTISHCDMIDSLGPCCHKTAPEGQRVCGDIPVSIPPQPEHAPVQLKPTRVSIPSFSSLHIQPQDIPVSTLSYSSSISSNSASSRVVSTSSTHCLPPNIFQQTLPVSIPTPSDDPSRVDLVAYIKQNGMLATLGRWLIKDMCNSGQVCIEWLVNNGCPLEYIKGQIPVTGLGLSLDKVYNRETLYKMFGKIFVDGEYVRLQTMSK